MTLAIRSTLYNYLCYVGALLYIILLVAMLGSLIYQIVQLRRERKWPPG